MTTHLLRNLVTSSSASSLMNNGSIQIRKSAERGHADHGWLNTKHTFSFASYFDRKYLGYRCLRVINEDRVQPSKGFGTHPHENYEIFSYVVRGILKHRDSLGNSELIERGGVQFTSAGSGIEHSEYNGSDKDVVHFLQVWIEPSELDLIPSYTTKKWTDDEKRNQLRLIISPSGEEGSIKINENCKVFASILEKDHTVKYLFPNGRQYGYIHLIESGTQSAVRVNDVQLEEGDGAFIEKLSQLEFTSVGIGSAEFLFFDLP